jgi:hypothetical protein
VRTTHFSLGLPTIAVRSKAERLILKTAIGVPGNFSFDVNISTGLSEKGQLLAKWVRLDRALISSIWRTPDNQ